MCRKKETPYAPPSSKEKIIKAACYYFVQRGYAATRTRDIAKRAGANLALLNYYFQNKEHLFRIVVQYQTSAVLQSLWPIMNAPETSLSQKIFLLIEHCSLLFEKNPQLPLFLFRTEYIGKPAKPPVYWLSQLLQKSMLARQLKAVVPGFSPEVHIQMLVLMIFIPHLGCVFSVEPLSRKLRRADDLSKKRWVRKCIQIIKRTEGSR